MNQKQDLISLAREFIQVEANAINEVAQQLDQSFIRAVELIVGCKGKIVFCGIGKSGHICYKLSSTFSSIGIPSVFLHPSEGVHGDLGLLDEKDVLVFISYSGKTAELGIPLKYASRKKIPVIAITGGKDSLLAQHSDVVLMTAISKEACPFNLAPTASTTAALVVGDALGLVCAIQKGYSAERFAEIHPAGSLGLRLTTVGELMYPPEQVPAAHENSPIQGLISKMTHGSVRGVAAVVDESGKLIGSVTDGDIRRFLETSNVDLTLPVSSLMAKDPKSISAEVLVEEALAMMEEFNLRFLFVINEKQQLLGLLHINSILKKKVR